MIKTDKPMQDNIDPAEVAKFDQVASHWWDMQGEFKPLHEINPLRLAFIQKQGTLAGKNVLDIGCGGGILTESLAQQGAEVTGIDMSAQALAAAQRHLQGQSLAIHYEQITAEAFAAQQPATFDIVTCMELLEHVPDPASLIAACAKLVKPGGEVFFSTINRSIKAYLFAVVGAEYVLNLLPKGTHDYAKFIRPSELSNWARDAGLSMQEFAGMSYQPFTKQYQLTSDTSVNYLVYARRDAN